MLKRYIITAFVLTAIVLCALPACASLVPMSWGFPTLVQNNSLTSFQSAFQNASDFETSDISFPTTSDGVLATSFPTISQVAQTGNLLTQMEYTHEQQYSQFAYPFLSIGLSPVPSMGML
jgi:hypothetical protein